MIFIKTVLDAPVPAELEVPTDDEDIARERDKNINWKIKK